MALIKTGSIYVLWNEAEQMVVESPYKVCSVSHTMILLTAGKAFPIFLMIDANVSLNTT